MIQAKVLYIAGYGRSGSTILEMLLAMHPEIVCGGELTNVIGVFSDPKARCSCGEAFAVCNVWGQVWNTFIKEAEMHGGPVALRQAFKNLEGRKNIHAAQHGLIDRKTDIYKSWCKINGLLFDTLLASKPGSRWIVDSSKSSGGVSARPYLLQANEMWHIKVLSLQRQVWQVLRSVSKGLNRDLERGEKNKRGGGSLLRSYLGWITANAVVMSINREFNNDEVLSIKYEDLVRNSEVILQAIAGLVAVDPRPLIDALNVPLLADHHMISGNRVRFSKGSLNQTKEPVPMDPLGKIGLGLSHALSKLHIL